MRMTRWISLICLAYIIWRPVSAGTILYPTLAVLAMVSLVDAKRPPNWLCHAAIPLALAIVVMLGFGSINNNDGFGQQATLWLGAPIIWGLWANSFSKSCIRIVLMSIFIATIVLSVVIVAYVAGRQGYIPTIVPDVLLNSQGARFTDDGFGTEIGFYGLSSLAAAAPMAAAGVFAEPAASMPPRWIMVIAAVSASCAALVGGRQAIIVVTLLAPVLFILVRRILLAAAHRGQRARLRINVAWVLAAPVAFLLAVQFTAPFAVPMSSAIRDAAFVFFGIGTGSSGSYSDNLARKTQTNQLLTAWADNPIFGAGMGATLPSGYTRSIRRPWSFELQYHQLLFQGGLLALALVACALLLALRGVVRAGRQHPEYTSALVVAAVGAAALLLANASNPYLQAPAHWWPLALVAGIATALTRTSRGTSAVSVSSALTPGKA